MAQAARRFAERWQGKGYEKGESQTFWLELLTEVFGVKEPSTFITFENQVKLDHTSFIDGYIERTHTMIEQKSLDKDLLAPIKQSDGTSLTPFQQAQRYSAALPYSKRPRWIVTCNFSTFLVYDMEHPDGDPFEIKLADLGKEYYHLRFLVETGADHLKHEEQVSMQAGVIVGKLYEALLKEYKDPTNPESLRSLNVLCVRLVFCLYSEDAGIFGKHDMFHDYLARYDIMDMRNALIRLFQILNTPLDERDPYLQEDLAAFPYASGGLFEGDIEIPRLNDEIRDLLLPRSTLTGARFRPPSSVPCSRAPSTPRHAAVAACITPVSRTSTRSSTRSFLTTSSNSSTTSLPSPSSSSDKNASGNFKTIWPRSRSLTPPVAAVIS